MNINTVFNIAHMRLSTASLSVGKAGSHTSIKDSVYQWLGCKPT